MMYDKDGLERFAAKEPRIKLEYSEDGEITGIKIPANDALLAIQAWSEVNDAALNGFSATPIPVVTEDGYVSVDIPWD